VDPESILIFHKKKKKDNSLRKKGKKRVSRSLICCVRLFGLFGGGKGERGLQAVALSLYTFSDQKEKKKGELEGSASLHL